MDGRRLLKRWRENYYIGNALAAIAKPLFRVSSKLSSEIPTKVRKNSASIRLPNGRILLWARDAGVQISSLLYWRGVDAFEPQTFQTLRFFFERCNTFLDVGANYGYYSLLGAAWNPELRVFSFEPVPRIYAGLCRNIAVNNYGNRVVATQAALSNHTGKAKFLLPEGESSDCEATGTLVTDGWQGRIKAPSFDVDTTTFDDFERGHPMKVDVVKIDVEDFEAGVLAGMDSTIRRDRPFIVCEILQRQHKNEETRKIVGSLGYTPYWIPRTNCYVRVSHFDFKREFATDFLLSPVDIGEVFTNLEDLWAVYQGKRPPQG